MKLNLASLISALRDNEDIFGSFDYFVGNVAHKHIEDEDERERMQRTFLDQFSSGAEWLDVPTGEVIDNADEWEMYEGDPEDRKEMNAARSSTLRGILITYPIVMEAARQMEPHEGIIGQRVAYYYRKFAENLSAMWDYGITGSSEAACRKIDTYVVEFRIPIVDLDAILQKLYAYINTVSSHADDAFNTEFARCYNGLYELRNIDFSTKKSPYLFQRFVDINYSQILGEVQGRLTAIVEAVSGTNYMTDELSLAMTAVKEASQKCAEQKKKLKSLAHSVFPYASWPPTMFGFCRQ